MQGLRPGGQRIVPHTYLVFWLIGWVLVLVGLPVGLIFLPDLWPWMITVSFACSRVGDPAGLVGLICRCHRW